MANPRRLPMVCPQTPWLCLPDSIHHPQAKEIFPQAQIWLTADYSLSRVFLIPILGSFCFLLVWGQGRGAGVLPSTGFLSVHLICHTLSFTSWSTHILFTLPSTSLLSLPRCPMPIFPTSMQTSPPPGSFPDYPLLPQYSILPLSWNQLYFCEWFFFSSARLSTWRSEPHLIPVYWINTEIKESWCHLEESSFFPNTMVSNTCFWFIAILPK